MPYIKTEITENERALTKTEGTESDIFAMLGITVEYVANKLNMKPEELLTQLLDTLPEVQKANQ